jgi:hypothetical protein
MANQPDCAQSLCDSLRAIIDATCKARTYPDLTAFYVPNATDPSKDCWCRCDVNCVDAIKRMGGELCIAALCASVSGQLSALCHSRGLPPNSPVLLFNDGKECYCCCPGAAVASAIADSAETFKLVQEFQIDDAVWVAGPDLCWRAATVVHSAGIALGGTERFMIALRYGPPGDDRALLVSEDQLFLTPDRTLIPAAKLTPGDTLVQPDGRPIRVHTVRPAAATRLHQIAASSSGGGTLDGHLLNINGVVTADYAVQLLAMTGQLDPALLVADLATRLTVGSDAYQQTYPDAEVPQFGGAHMHNPGSDVTSTS